MKRRRILRFTAYTAGAAIVAPLAVSLLSGCKGEQTVAIDLDGDYTPDFFSDKEYQFIHDMADALLPKTDTLGAVDVGVPQMFDIMVGKVYKPEDQVTYKAKLGSLMSHVNAKLKSTSTSKITDIIGALDLELRNSEKNDTDIAEAYLDIRSKAMGYYVGSEEVGTTLLNYLPVPGDFVPCIDLTEVGGKAWAL